jgi:hypothetical protein
LNFDLASASGAGTGAGLISFFSAGFFSSFACGVSIFLAVSVFF